MVALQRNRIETSVRDSRNGCFVEVTRRKKRFLNRKGQLGGNGKSGRIQGRRMQDDPYVSKACTTSPSERSLRTCPGLYYSRKVAPPRENPGSGRKGGNNRRYQNCTKTARRGEIMKKSFRPVKNKSENGDFGLRRLFCDENSTKIQTDFSPNENFRFLIKSIVDF